MKIRIFISIILFLYVVSGTMAGQSSSDWLRRENSRLKAENDSLRNVISGFGALTVSTWDALSNLEWEDDIAEVFGSSSVAYNPDAGHTDLMQKIREGSPSVASSWNQALEDHISLYTGRKRKSLPTIFGRYELWYPLFQSTFRRYGVPEELIALCIVESAVSRRAVSPAGAAGIWQLMPSTARGYGLRVDEFVDERFDVRKATDVAARMLRDLYKSLHRWDLCVLSYNCGSGRVRKAIISAGGSSDVWDIMQHLPAETKAYLPSFLAARYVLTQKDILGISVRRQGAFPKTKTINLETDTTLSAVAKTLQIRSEMLTELNPQFILGFIPAGVPFQVPS